MLRLFAWPSRLVTRYLGVLFIVAFVLANYVLWTDAEAWGGVKGFHEPISFSFKHPIKRLIHDARERHEEKLSRRSFDVHDAAARYRQARGRHPPPGFDTWFQAALDSDSIVVEDYFDRIYKDLAPWWGSNAAVTRARAHSWPWVVRVRNGNASGVGDVEGRVPWLQLWTGLVQEFAEHLPEVDMPINYMDEPRLLVPHDEIAELVEKEQSRRTLRPINEVTSDYQGLATVDAEDPKFYDPQWWGPDNSYWDLAVKTCPPDSPAYGVEATTDYWGPAEFPQDYHPSYAYKGFVRNWTAATDPCEQPHLRQLHGSFVEPVSLSTTNELIPLFGGSKLPMNNEILIPGAMYLTDDEFYSGGDSHGPHWNKKIDGVVWRGDASGGRTRAETWQHFHRHRLIDMLNATSVAMAEDGAGRTLTYELPDTSIYTRLSASRKKLSSWIRDIADVGFVTMCPPGECGFIYRFFQEVEPKPMKDQYRFKFLPDADGNSFSARFRGFMRSTSVPLKATIYAEWHDDRLIPWAHFIPLDNTFRDLYPVLEYFMSDGRDGEGDADARTIAESGQHWAEKVLRREDMRLYVWRLLLEWARVCDDNRDSLGYVDDLR